MNNIEKQYLLEEGTVSDTIAKYNLLRSKDKNLAHFPSGNKILKTHFVPLKNAIIDFLNTCKLQAYEASLLKSLKNHKGQIAVNYMAYYTLEVILEYADNRDAGTLYRASRTITHRVIDSLNYSRWAEENTAMQIKMESDVQQKGMSVARKYYIYKKAVEQFTSQVITMSADDKIRAGFLLLELAEKSLNLIELKPYRNNKTMKDKRIILWTEETREWIKKAHVNNSQDVNYTFYPMLCEPLDWTNHNNGGYLIRNISFIKTHKKNNYKEEDSVKVREAANKLQKQAFQINRDVYNVFKTLKQNNSTLGGLVKSSCNEAPGKPWSDDAEYQYYKENHPEMITSWKNQMVDYYKRKSSETSKRISQEKLQGIVEKFLEEEAFYFVYTADWRGRLYAESNYLNPQGDDLSKGLLQFSVGKKITEAGLYWLRVHLANTYGYDKASFEDRVKWVANHEQEILAVAVDPYANNFWDSADSPFCFLAACIDYSNYLKDPEDHLSHIVVAMDATCSGLQHLSALLRDEVGGKAVNLTKEDKRFDIYTEVKNRVVEIVHEDAVAGDVYAIMWDGKIDRGFVKRQTMTTAYSATVIGFIDQIEAEIEKREKKTGESLFSKSEKRKACVYLAKVSKRAIGEVVIGSKEVMSWLQEVSKMFNEYKQPITWTTPTGFTPYQDYKKQEKVIISHMVAGEKKLILQKDADETNTRKQVSSISPNVIHSLDAAHLHLTVNACPADMSLAFIHDSFGCHASDIPELHRILREEFVKIYSQPMLDNFRKEWEGKLKVSLSELNTPKLGNLDIQEVLESRYFFS